MRAQISRPSAAVLAPIDQPGNPTPQCSTDQLPWPHFGNGPLRISISEGKIGRLLLGLSKCRSPNLKCASPQEIDEQRDAVEIEVTAVAVFTIDDLFEGGRQAVGISLADLSTRTVNVTEHTIRATRSS